MSTYSSTLRIELIGAGEQDGVWGDTTNSNLGTIIEAAITNVVDITFSNAQYTLSANNGLPDEARNAVLNLIGSNSGPQNLIAPSVDKTYIVKNATGAAVTIKTSGGTGVAILDGATQHVWCDGTNFYASTIPSGAGTTGTGNLVYSNSPTLTGTPIAPTAALGTNTTQIATTAFVTAALQAAYPVGSVYMNASNATNPNALLGFGTWTSFGAGRMPVGFNAADPLFDVAEETGGSKDAIVVSHTHTATSTSTVTDPGHNHNIVTSAGGAGAFRVRDDTGPERGTYQTSTATTGISVATSTTNASTGSSGTNANLPPYITVYMWKRTA